jgi:hypothetical protein
MTGPPRPTAPDPRYAPATLAVDLPSLRAARRNEETVGDRTAAVVEALRESESPDPTAVGRALGLVADPPDAVAFLAAPAGALSGSGPAPPASAAVRRLDGPDGPAWVVLTDGRRWRLYGDDGRRGPAEERYHGVDLPSLRSAGREAVVDFVACFALEAFRPSGDESFHAALSAADAARREAVRESLAHRAVEAHRRLSTGDRDGAAFAHLAALAADLFAVDRTGTSVLLDDTDAFAAARAAVRDAAPADEADPERPAVREAHVRTLRRWIRRGGDPDARSDLPLSVGGTPAASGTAAGARRPSRGADAPREADASSEVDSAGAADSLSDADVVAVAARLFAAPTASRSVGVDYRTVDGRLLGTVYERLLDRGDAGDAAPWRKDSGSFYTPEAVVTSLVEHTVGELAADARAAVRDDGHAPATAAFAAALRREVRSLDVLDPATGAGYFLVAATRRLAACVRRAARAADAPVDPAHAARRAVVEACVHGVDTDPTAAALARLALWVETLGGDGTSPPAGAGLRVGDALLGPAPGEPPDDSTAAVDDAGTAHPLRWDDAFPDVFETGGFDAVVGNPPWKGTAGRAGVSARMDADVRSALCDRYESAAGAQPNLYAAFLERARELAPDGRFGLVVPDAALVRMGAEPLRRYLLREGGLTHLMRVGRVFPDANEGAALVVGGPSGSDPIRTWYGDADEFVAAVRAGSVDYGRLRRDVVEADPCARFPLLRDDETDAVCRKVERLDPLASAATVARGEEFGKRDSRLRDAPAPDTVPIVGGVAVRPFGVGPDAVAHVAADAVEKDVYDPPKLVARQTGGFLVAALDKAGVRNLKSVYDVHHERDDPDALRHLLGLLNSTPYNFYHYVTRTAYPAEFPQTNQRNYETLPVWGDAPDEELVGLVDDRIDVARHLLALDADVESYVPFDRATVPLDAFDPTAVGDGLLSAHRGEVPGLAVDSLSVDADGAALVVRVAYDRDGATPTAPRDALRFEGLDDRTRTVLRAWLPAVDGATQSARRETGLRPVGRSPRTTPEARLRALRVPDPDDHAEAVSEYLDARDRAVELGRRAGALDAAIDDRVASLVGLTDDERARVRETMVAVTGWTSLRDAAGDGG